jgi:hypothetical protein
MPAPQGVARNRGQARPEDIQAIKDLLIKKDLEVGALKDEIGALKRQLADRDAALDRAARVVESGDSSAQVAITVLCLYWNRSFGCHPHVPCDPTVRPHSASSDPDAPPDTA